MVNRVPYKLGRSRSTSQTIAKYSRFVALYLRLASVMDQDQYPICFILLSECRSSNAQPMRALQA